MKNSASSGRLSATRLAAICAGVGRCAACGAIFALWASLSLPTLPSGGKACLAPTTSLRSTSAQPPEMEAQQVAETYLRALLCGDRETALGLSPTRPENKFGPCPLAQMPQLGSARVDAHRAAVTFVGFRPPPFDRLRAGSAGRALDPQAPGDGAVLLTRLDQVRGNPWRVRQVAFFTKAPLGTRVPSRSITREDVAQEPLAQAAARRYIAAWLKGDYRTMQNLAFDWLARLHRSSHGLRIRSIELSSEAAPGGEARINFTARIILYRALPRRVQGTVFAMREDGEWKIRASELTL